jgi:hypothetical protein
MIAPEIEPRVKEQYGTLRVGIAGVKVRPLEKIAPVARQGKIVEPVAAPLPPRDDVLDLKLVLFLRHAAILAAPVSATPQRTLRSTPQLA